MSQGTRLGTEPKNYQEAHSLASIQLNVVRSEVEVNFLPRAVSLLVVFPKQGSAPLDADPTAPLAGRLSTLGMGQTRAATARDPNFQSADSPGVKTAPAMKPPDDL